MKKIFSLFLACALIICFVPSCRKNEEAEYYDTYFTGMDTQITLRLARDSGQREKKKIIYFEDSHLEEIARACSEIVNKTEAMLSRTLEDSLVYDVNKEVDSILSLDKEFIDIIKNSLSFSAATSGAYDITVGTLCELWSVTQPNADVPSDEEIAEALSHVGYDKISVNEDSVKKSDRKTKIDLGAVGKGYALSKIISYLETTDVLYGLVSFGGNVAVFGSKGEENTSYKIGITNPSDTSRVAGYVYIDSGFVSVSGDYERYFEKDGVRYHHIFDASSGYPAKSDVSSVAVICAEGDKADTLSTALFVMGSEDGLEFYRNGKYEFEAVFIKKDGSLILTDGLSESGKFEVYVDPQDTAD